MRMLKSKKFLAAAVALLAVSGLGAAIASAGSNIIPLMTSNSNALGTAYASSEWGGHEAYRAFDHDDSTYWSTSSGVYGELRFTFNSPKKVTTYTVRTSSQPLENVPKTWTFQGSDDGVSWTVLDNVSYYLSPNWTYTFSIPNNNYYNRYRLVITANNGGYSTSVAEVQMFE